MVTSLVARPLAVVSAAFAAGAWAGSSLGLILPRAAWAAALFACLLAAVALARPRLRALGLPLAALALGLCRGAWCGPTARDPALETVLPELTEPTALQGRVLESERSAPDRRRVLLEVHARELRPGDPSLPIEPVRALITLRDSTDPMLLGRRQRRVPRPGDRLRLLARLRLPRPALNPGGRDEARELDLRGIAYAGTADEDGLEIIDRGPALWRWLAEVREGFARRCAEVCASRERGALVAALAVGLRADLPREVDDELAASGLIHLLASAGLHLAAVCLAIQWICSKLWLRTRWAARARASLIGALCALPFALCEVALLGASWPAVRAGLAAALWLLAGASGRRSDAVTALALTAALCGLHDPAALHDLPLLLSLAGVAGLIFLTGPLRELIPLEPRGGRWGKLLERALMAGCATAAATLCTAPLQAATFHRVSLVGVLANALALWPGLFAIPVATLAVPLDALAPPLALPLFWLADLCAGATLWAAHLFAAAPSAQLALAAPGVVTIALWSFALLLFAGWPSPIGPDTAALRPALRLRLLRASVPLALLALASGAGAAWRRLDPTLRITFFAVGQGDAALVRFPGGRSMLVDAGGALFDPRSDATARELWPALAQLGVSRLDWAVLTHPHPDHGGGFPWLLPRLEPRELWTTGEPGPGALGDRVRAQGLASGAALVEPAAGQSLVVGGVRVEVLHPRRWDPGRSANDNSLVLRLVHGNVAVLLAGDLEALSEAELAQSGSQLKATLLKAPHHGSRTSSTDAFLSRVQPRHVVFCVGERNPFGFPHADVVDRYHRSGCQLWQTSRGAVSVESDGEHLTVHQAPLEGTLRFPSATKFAEPPLQSAGLPAGPPPAAEPVRTGEQ